MFKAFHEKRDEGGFTLIELLVVILIIAILAAIAIPVFLKQREKGWISQAESALKNAATAEQSFATTANGDYCHATSVPACTGNDPQALQDEGFRPVSDAPVTVHSTSNANYYCLEVNHAKLGVDYFYSASTGKPKQEQSGGTAGIDHC